MNLMTTAVAAIAMGLAAAAHADEIVNISATSAAGTTVSLAAGTYDVSYAGIAGGGLYDGFSLYNTGGFTDELAITLGSSTNFNTSVTYDYLISGSQALYATAHQALLAYQNALATDSLSRSANYANQDYTSTVGQISFTLATAGDVTFTAPDVYYPDNTGGVSVVLAPAAVPEPASFGLLGAGLLGLVMARRRAV